jgi:threonyl-tRNA synthetase
MREIVAENQPFVREELDVEAGLALFADQPYKCEIISAVRDGGTMRIAESATPPSCRPMRNSEGFVDLLSRSSACRRRRGSVTSPC